MLFSTVSLLTSDLQDSFLKVAKVSYDTLVILAKVFRFPFSIYLSVLYM